MSQARVIAIDGPAASGKSTLGERLAKALGYLYVDTGIMYRAVTLAALRASVPIEDEATVTKIAQEIDLDILPPSKPDGRMYDILIDGEDVTWEIRSSQVDANVSQVSMYPGVREAMTRRQREIGKRGRVVMVGRDIGTVVLPDADLKIYLDASVEARAERRHKECQERGEPADLENILEAMRARDHLDSTRVLAPLRPAPDAVIIDTTSMDREQVFARVMALAKDPSSEASAGSGQDV